MTRTDQRTKARPRVLFLTCHLPFPPMSGGRRREFELIRRIASDVDVHLCCVSKTPEEDLANAGHLGEYCTQVDVFAADEDKDQAWESSPLPHQVLRHRSSDLTERVHSIVKPTAFDLIHVEAFYMMQHVPDTKPVPVLLVEQNVEYALWRQRTRSAVDSESRKRSLRQYLKTLEAEIEAWRRSDLTAAVTEEDRLIMSSALRTAEVRLVPDGSDHLSDPVDLDSLVREIRQPGPAVVFVGNFAYEPNLDAALYLIDEIWPRLTLHQPRARLWLVGNDPPSILTSAAERVRGVIVTGRVDSVEPYLIAADVVACPLRIGGGIKVKVLEALYAGKAIVTTSVGAQGLRGPVEDVLRIRDEPISFADEVARLLNRPDERARVGSAAGRYARELPTWDEAAQALRACYAELIARSRRETHLVPAASPTRIATTPA